MKNNNKISRRSAKEVWEDLVNVVKDKNGTILSSPSVYKNSLTKIDFKCEHGHMWSATSNAILNLNSWCPECFNERARRVGKQKVVDCGNWSRLVDYVASKNATLLTSESLHTNNTTVVDIKCSCGNHFSNNINNLVNAKQWCPVCADKLLREKAGLYDRLKVYVEEKGGKLLTPKSDYKNARTRVKIMCEHGDIWDAGAGNVLYLRTWCPVCKYRNHMKK